MYNLFNSAQELLQNEKTTYVPKHFMTVSALLTVVICSSDQNKVFCSNP